MATKMNDDEYDRIDLVLTKEDLIVHRYFWRDWMDRSSHHERRSWRKMLVDAMPLRQLAEEINSLIQSSESFRRILEIDTAYGFVAHNASYFEPTAREALTSQPTVPVPPGLLGGIKAALLERMNTTADEADDEFSDMGYVDEGRLLILACASIGYTPTLRIHVTAEGTHEAHIYNSSQGWHALEARAAIDPTNHQESVRTVMTLWDAAQ